MGACEGECSTRRTPKATYRCSVPRFGPSVLPLGAGCNTRSIVHSVNECGGPAHAYDMATQCTCMQLKVLFETERRAGGYWHMLRPRWEGRVAAGGVYRAPEDLLLQVCTCATWLMPALSLFCMCGHVHVRARGYLYVRFCACS